MAFHQSDATCAEYSIAQYHLALTVDYANKHQLIIKGWCNIVMQQ